ncbi:MAG: hypothetical protein AB8C46_11685 [Burkholderiaceae bacterium]
MRSLVDANESSEDVPSLLRWLWRREKFLFVLLIVAWILAGVALLVL